MHGQFVWYELTTPDVDAAKKFYPSITGWGTQAFDKDYTMWTTGGVPLAGIFKLGPDLQAQGVPPNWMPYIEANNVDETARLAQSLGGTVVVPPADIPGTGRFAVLQDPQGATFGIYKSNRASQAWDGTPTLSRFSWHELMTTDHPRALAFYQRLFGWEKTSEMDMGGGNMYVLYGKGQKMYGGMFNRMPEMGSMPSFWLCYILVKDGHKVVDTATNRGATVVREPMPIPGGMIAILADPQGAGFAVHHMDVPAEAPKPAAKQGAARAASSASRPKRAPVRKARSKAKTRAKTKSRSRATSKARTKSRTKSRPSAARKRSTSRKRPSRKASAGRARPRKSARRKVAKKRPRRSR